MLLEAAELCLLLPGPGGDAITGGLRCHLPQPEISILLILPVELALGLGLGRVGKAVVASLFCVLAGGSTLPPVERHVERDPAALAPGEEGPAGWVDELVEPRLISR